VLKTLTVWYEEELKNVKDDLTKPSDDLTSSWRIILKWILKKQVRRIRIEFS
jgi:hypothetical protein